MTDSGLFGNGVKEYLEKTGSKNKEYDAGLDGLIDDSDKVDTEHAADIVTEARVKAHFPDTIADILSDHDTAAHDALGIDAATLDGLDSLDFINKDGSVMMTGNLDLNKKYLIFDDDADTYLQSVADDTLLIYTGNGMRVAIVNTYIEFQIPLRIDTINEKTAGVGVTVDTCLIKDGYAKSRIADISDIPGTIASILTDHDKAAHDPLGINADACLVVAANDTPAILKNRADYACDGVDDQSEINTALGIADTVILCPGTFILDDPISMGDNQSLFGSGPASILKRKDSSAAMDIITNLDDVGGNINLMVANLMIDGNEANNASSGNGISWKMVNYSKVTNCWIFNCYTDAIKFGGSGTPLKSTKYCIIEDCIMENNGYGPAIEYGSDYCVVKGCIIRKTAKIAIYIKQSNNLSIIGNTIFESSQDEHNTYDHITVNGSATTHADFINIRDNIIRQGAEANKARYAVNILDADCNRVLIANNDCWDACAGATTFVDSGTNTNWGAGNRKKDGTWAVGV